LIPGRDGPDSDQAVKQALGRFRDRYGGEIASVIHLRRSTSRAASHLYSGGVEAGHAFIHQDEVMRLFAAVVEKRRIAERRDHPRR
jgi:hypothetical protein